MVGVALISAGQGRGETTSGLDTGTECPRCLPMGSRPPLLGQPGEGLEALHGLTEACSWGCVLPTGASATHAGPSLHGSELRKEKEAIPHNRENTISKQTKQNCTPQ